MNFFVVCGGVALFISDTVNTEYSLYFFWLVGPKLCHAYLSFKEPAFVFVDSLYFFL